MSSTANLQFSASWRPRPHSSHFVMPGFALQEIVRLSRKTAGLPLTTYVCTWDTFSRCSRSSTLTRQCDEDFRIYSPAHTARVRTHRSPRNESNLCHAPRLLAAAYTWMISWPAWSPRHLEQRARPAQLVQKKLQQPALLVERHASRWSGHGSKKFVVSRS